MGTGKNPGIKNILQLFIKNISDNTNPTDFLTALTNFLENQFTAEFCETLISSEFPPFIYPLIDQKNNTDLKTTLLNSKNKKQKNVFIKIDNYYIYKLSKSYNSKFILLVFNKNIDKKYDEMIFICEFINHIFKMVVSSHQNGTQESTVLNANIISQMCHDINSLISLTKSGSKSNNSELTNKIKYIEKMSADVLHFARNTELLESEVDLLELLESILSTIEYPDNIIIDTKFDFNLQSILLDVELMYRVIKEIIDNAMFAIGENPGKINLIAEIKKSENPILNNKYFQLTIQDNGQGINPDFVQFVKNPFFTTWKSEFHSGLGFSIALKIIEAHGGELFINESEKNCTQVTIYLPIKEKQNE